MGEDSWQKLKTASSHLARDAWNRGELQHALEFLNGIEATSRPADVEAGVCDALMKEACDNGAWGRALAFAERVVATGVDRDFSQRRLHALRARVAADLTDERFALMLEDPAPSRLVPAALAPDVDGVLAVGTYVAWHTPSKLTNLMRVAKRSINPDERDGAMRLLAALLSRYLIEFTDYLAVIDIATAVPTDPDRFLERDRRSLPDVLGRGVQHHCGVPYEPDLIERTRGQHVKMSELGHAARRRAVRGLYRCGRQSALAEGRAVLLVDDITTSGATLRECGKRLKESGAAYVFALAIAHTEG